MAHPLNRIVRDPAFLGRVSRLYELYASDAELNEVTNGLFTFLFDDLPLQENTLLNVGGEDGDYRPALDIEYVVLPEEKTEADELIDRLLDSLDFDYSVALDVVDDEMEENDDDFHEGQGPSVQSDL